MYFICSTDVAQLKEKQADFTVQYHIAIDLLYAISSKSKFVYHPQCILDAVQLVTVTISNLQRVEEVLLQTEWINKSELEQFHNTVEGHVRDLLWQITKWLPSVLPGLLSATDPAELSVSIMLQSRNIFTFTITTHRFIVLTTVYLHFYPAMLCIAQTVRWLHICPSIIHLYATVWYYFVKITKVYLKVFHSLVVPSFYY